MGWPLSPFGRPGYSVVLFIRSFYLSSKLDNCLFSMCDWNGVHVNDVAATGKSSVGAIGAKVGRSLSCARAALKMVGRASAFQLFSFAA